MRKTNFLLMMAMVILAAPFVSARAPYKLTDLGEGIAHSINNSGRVVGIANYPSWELPDGSFAAVPHATIFDSTGGGSNIYLSEGRAYSINNNGQIVGQSGILSNQVHPTLFNPTDDGNNFDLIILSDNSSCAYSINDSGQIVGGGAVLFDATGQGNNIDLGNGSAYSINNNGQVVGASSDSLPSPFPTFSINTATLFDPTGTGNNLTLDPGNSLFFGSMATSINNYGQIVGYAATQNSTSTTNPAPAIPSSSFQGPAASRRRAVKQKDFQVVEPDIISGSGPIPPPTIIIDPNFIITIDPNFIINFGPYTHATLFDPTGNDNNIDLGTLPGGLRSYAYSINDNDQIVGYSYTSHIIHAAMFDPTGGGDNVDLNELIEPDSGWVLTEARCINDNGWIVGQMTNSEGDEHAFLITPTPLTIAIDNIDEAIAEKLYALESIDIALDLEFAALESLNEMLASGDFGDLTRRDIHRAKLSIYRSIQRQMRSKAELHKSIKGLERSLELLNAD